MSKIKVKITGNVGVGKSAILQLIKETLYCNGIEVEHKKPEHSDRTVAALNGIIADIRRNGITIILSEKSNKRTKKGKL